MEIPISAILVQDKETNIWNGYFDCFPEIKASGESQEEAHFKLLENFKLFFNNVHEQWTDEEENQLGGMTQSELDECYSRCTVVKYNACLIRVT